MSDFGARHMELFGPDFARGPFASSRPEIAALQIATQLAQLRAPLLRSDAEIGAHAEFIQSLADKLMPDFASALKFDVGGEVLNAVSTTFRTNINNYSLLEVWLADDVGGGLTTLTPTTITWNTGVVLAELTVRKHYLIITSNTGIASATVSYSAARTWYWGVARMGRAYYSSSVFFS